MATAAQRPFAAQPLFLMRQVDRDVLPLRVTLQHAVERELAADAAFFVAAVGVTRALAQTLVDLNPTSLDRVSRTQRPAAQGAGRRMYADGRQAQRTQRRAAQSAHERDLVCQNVAFGVSQIQAQRPRTS